MKKEQLEIKESLNDLFAGGEGTMEKPYLISKPKHLNNIRKVKMTKNTVFRQINDIDLSGILWKPIVGFRGIFNGGGYEIKNLKFMNADNGDTTTNAMFVI